MSVLIGSARIDENGKAYGGKAGDQTGREVSTQAWYKHQKGWRVFRFKDAALAERVAAAMQAACDNNNVGYDQYQRATLRTLAATLSPAYWPGAVKSPCETDCSDLVRTCVAYAAGRDVISGNMNTENEPAQLLKTGLFEELTGIKYTDQTAYLRRGDILCTKVKGHTAIVLANGSKIQEDLPFYGILHYGDSGEKVKSMQALLLEWRSTCLPRCGADGDFGTETMNAVRAFQTAHKLPVTGAVDADTLEALGKYKACGRVRIVGTTVNVRNGAGVVHPICAPVVKCGDEYPFTEKTEVTGVLWYHIPTGWVSGKFTKEV